MSYISVLTASGRVTAKEILCFRKVLLDKPNANIVPTMRFGVFCAVYKNE
jgi:hypothetical protein